MNSDVSSGSAADPLDSSRTLDEFVPERTSAAPASCESLFDIKAVPPRQPTSSPRPLSRSDARQARRQQRRQARWRPLLAAAAAVRDWMYRTGDAIGHGGRETARVTRGRVLRRVSQRLASLRLASTGESRVIAAPAGGAALDDREWTGFAVASLLAIAVMGYGGFLTTAWRTPAARISEPIALVTPAAAPAPPPAVGIAAAAIPDRIADPPRAAPAAALARGQAAVRGAVFTPSPQTLTAMWQRRDTRSLEHAFATLRQQTLALHRCGMRMTDTDRAVARCEGVATATGGDGTATSRAATWTIDFRRTAGRWAIASVRMR
jgi:hypothetical protein